ncbi:MAG: response regulator [Prosthecobacter sp.]
MSAPAAAPQPVRVLIVDDSPTDRMAFKRHLIRGTPDPCEVAETSTAREAMEHLAQHPVDCVLLDFDLPDSDGLKLVRSIVATHGTHAFGIVMLTSATNVEVAVQALHCGAHDFLQKSAADAIALRRAVDNAVEKVQFQCQIEEQRQALAEKNRDLEVNVRRLEAEAAERRRVGKLLRESEQQLRLVTDHAAVLLAHCDSDGRYKFVNRPYARRFGLEPRHIVGRHITEVLGAEAYAAVETFLQAALAGHQVEFEVQVPYDTMGPRWMNVVYAPEILPNGTVIGVVGVMTDTTQRKNGEKDLEKARDEAVAASQAKDDFLAALSHELRTPLNPVLLLASSAAEDERFPPEVRAIFETIHKNVDLEARLIDDLLNITRISRGKLALERKAVDAHSVIKDAIANVSADVAQKHLSLRTRFSAKRQVLDGDAVRLQQVFWNVLKNAVKFTAEGGEITIATSNPPGAEDLEITVTDTGIGMTREELARVFDAFTQGEHAGGGGSHRFGGLGLGLAISRMLVQSHAGQIQADSPGPGLGSIFTIRLPLAAQPEEWPTQRGMALRPAGASRPNKAENTRILLVEDHEATRAALQQLLSRRRYQVTAVGTGAEAIAVAKEEGFDLLISDIGLPDCSGYDLMEALSKDKPVKGIALTGYGMERDISRSRNAGFQAHLTKPIRMESLEKAIAETLAVSVSRS